MNFVANITKPVGAASRGMATHSLWQRCQGGVGDVRFVF